MFGLIGLELPTLVRDLARPGAWPLTALALAATLIAIRALWVFPLWTGRQWRQRPRRRPGRFRPWCPGPGPAG